MILTPFSTSHVAPRRATGEAAFEPAPAATPGYEAKKVAASLLMTAEAPSQRGPNRDKLLEIAGQSADPFEKAVAQTAAEVAAQQMHHTTAVALQAEAFAKIAVGTRAPIGTVLAEIGLKGIGAAREADETRRVGNGILEAIAAHSQNPTEVVLARAARQAAGMQIYHETGASFVRAALTQIKDGVTGTPTQEVARLGQQIPPMTREISESCNMSLALFSSLSETTANRTATALTSMSSGHAQASQGLQQAQQEAFADLAAGRESQYADTKKAELLNSNKDALTCALGGAATQAALASLGAAGAGGLGGMIVGTLVGMAAFGAVKGVYHGLMEKQAREAGPRRYDQEYVGRGFQEGFSHGLKTNVLRGLLHGGINSMAYAYLGFPASLVVGPGVSAALGKMGI